LIPEGRSFHDTADGISCLDCAKVTNHGHSGTRKAAAQPKLEEAGASADSHPVNFIFVSTLSSYLSILNVNCNFSLDVNMFAPSVSDRSRLTLFTEFTNVRTYFSHIGVFV
jgi:hypothetical protein